MIAAADRALVACEAARCARALYGPDHRSVRAALERAEHALLEALAERESVTVMLVEERVVCDGVTLPSSAALAAGLFRRLATLGIEWVRFGRGATRADLNALLDRVDRSDRAPEAWNAGPIRAGFIRGVADRSTIGSTLLDSEVAALNRPASLERLWRAVAGEGRVEAAVLHSVVAEIGAASMPAGGTLLQLASLKGHDEYTFVHTVNVAILSAALAQSIGLPPDDVHDITVAALLHDIGKSAVPQELLNKQGALTDEERAAVRRHPVEGAVMLFNARDLPLVAPIVAFEHHVRVDGAGYPGVPPGWRTSLPTRVVQVADVFDALRTTRPYRAAMPVADVIATLRRDAGTALDAELVEVFLARVALQTDRERAEIHKEADRAAA